MERSYESILSWYEARLQEHGDTNLGVGWPDQKKAERLYEVMLGIAPRNEPVRILDFGCGPARMVDWMRQRPEWSKVEYTGLDFNADSLQIARQKYPELPFIHCDLLHEPFEGQFDYIIMDGVLTMKAQMSFEDMWAYAQKLLERLFTLATRGLAFNVMSKAVDWERDDLFHLPTDLLIQFLVKRLSRRFILRQDYAPYEYTAYVFH